MPPVRRRPRRDAHHPASSPYLTDGWLSRRRRTVRGRRADAESDDNAPTPSTLVPDDVLFCIFSHASAADVARCAATCRRWGDVVATRAAAISRTLPVPPPPATFMPHLALGVLFPQRKSAREGARLRFVPTAAFASSSRRLRGPFTGGGVDLDLDHARPVASRNGHLVLELRSAGGLTLCVWNPMTGAVSVLPPLSGEDYPGGGDYACAILTTEDIVDGPPGFFRVLIVYERRRCFTALRCFSSDTDSWGAEAKKPGAKISGRVLRQLRPAVVLRGVAYWSTHCAAFGVRMDGSPSTMDVFSVPYELEQIRLDDHMLGVSPEDGRLRYIETGFVAMKLLIIRFLTSTLQNHQADDDDIRIPIPEIELTNLRTSSAVKLRWFGEKSGTLIVTVEETGRSTSDVFAFNLGTRSVEKLAQGVSNHACRNLFGYEMIAQHSFARSSACTDKKINNLICMPV